VVGDSILFYCLSSICQFFVLRKNSVTGPFGFWRVLGMKGSITQSHRVETI
jgi:hypothetical protein